MSIRDAIERETAKAGPEAFQPATLTEAHNLGRTIGTLVLAAGPVGGQMFDAKSTMDGKALGLQEQNPFMRDLVEQPWQFYAVKAILGASMGACAWLLRKQHKDREAAIVSVLGTAAGAVPAMLNKATIKRARR